MELWQLDTIAVDDREKALIALCEAQESELEDLRYSLKEVEGDRDSYEWDADDNYRQLEEMEKKRDEIEQKMDEIEEILTDDDDEKIVRLKILLGC